MKSFTVKTQYKFGLSDKTKSLIQARDKTRQSIGIACAKSKPTPMKKYKILRNKVTSSRTFPEIPSSVMGLLRGIIPQKMLKIVEPTMRQRDKSKNL